MFLKAQVVLHDEIDILHIIKQLRVNSFAMELILRPG